MRAAAALAVAAALLHPDAAAAQTRRAVVVGIDAYQGAAPAGAPAAEATAAPEVDLGSTPSRRRGGWYDLDGAVNDAVAIRALLVERYGFLPEDVVLLRDGEATRDAIVAAFRRVLVDAARPGDVGVFYFAGHGSQVLNSRSPEPDHLDETLVPADSRAGAPDLRDKELAALFVEAAARLRLTVILDACHSGGAMRGAGKARSLPPDLGHDVADPEPAPRPEAHGVLVLAAALDAQTAGEARDRDGRPHGAFTNALLEVLRRLPPDAGADSVFAAARAAMREQAPDQEPILAAWPERRRAPLFGFGAARGGPRVAVAGPGKLPGAWRVQAGHALGLGPGTILRAPGPGGARLVVREVTGPAASVATVVEGDSRALRAGELLAIERWVPPERARIRVAIPASPPALRDLGRRVAALVGPGRDGPAAVELVADEAQADYALAQDAPGTAGWARRAARGPLPARTAAVAVAAPGAAEALAGLLLRLARARAWIALDAPAAPGAFPYDLVLERAGDGAGAGAEVRSGTPYRLALRRAAGADGGRWKPHFVYVLAIGPDAAVRVVFPARGVAVENRLPVIAADDPSVRAPALVPLGQPFAFEAPFGRETFVLVASLEAVPDLDAVEQPGVGEVEGSAVGPAELLSRGTRGASASEPWLLRRVEVTSVPAAR